MMTAAGMTKLDSQPLVAICLATFNPPIHLFERQVDSIVNQTYSNWVCIVSDDCSLPAVGEMIREIVSRDPRFRLDVAPSRLGIYRNFERCLLLAPPEATFIALADHDDFWHSDKLQVLLSQFEGSTTLAYSDMNIVDIQGQVISNTFWTARPNNCSSLASLILANTVTGAASMFPRRLLDFALPFPDDLGALCHDHWLACVALALGDIKYVDRPLYDYVQHANNAIGHAAAAAKASSRERLVSFWNAVTSLGYGKLIYYYDIPKLRLIAMLLQMRCGPYLTSAKRGSLRHVMSLESSAVSLLWLLTRSIRHLIRPSETLEAEQRLLSARLWRILAGTYLWPSIGAPSAATKDTTAIPEADPERVHPSDTTSSSDIAARLL